MADTDPANPTPGTTIGDVAGDIDHSLIAGRDIIGNLLVTGDHNQVFAGGYERLADAYIKPHEVFDRVHLEHFTGREWLLAAVDAFLQDHDCGYFILEADAGLGKTTFMAWLVKQRKLRAPLQRAGARPRRRRPGPQEPRCAAGARL